MSPPMFGTLWPSRNALFGPRNVLCTSDLCGNSMGLASTTTSNTVWSSANRAIFWPLIIEQAITVTSLFLMNGTTIAGNIDLGLYASDGTRILSTGSTAQSGSQVIQSIAVTSTNIGPGLYYMAMALSDGTTANTRDLSIVQAMAGRAAGLLQMDSAFPLPATATFATLTTIAVPIGGLIGTYLNSDRKVVMPPTVHTYSALADGASAGANGATLSGMVGATYPTSNKAFYVPFVLPVPITLTQLFCGNGSAVSGNIDVGIYEKSGARIISSGSTAQSGTTTLQLFDVADTELGPGEYYLAVAMNNTTGTLFRTSNTSIAQALGIQQQTTAFPLPATASFTSFTAGIIPLVGFTTQAVI